ncbi:glycosyl hydrolase family 18 protein [Oerskovia sp. Root22]|uniref:glycosyl hydrolase family 18 protein n=1 Tax=Oerskovia sp. Root22 TaxID=1736494 RepID=UPI0009EBC8CA|nr:glycosyl hydrolase family 18 protein [Oerskovia sp. Root22]
MRLRTPRGRARKVAAGLTATAMLAASLVAGTVAATAAPLPAATTTATSGDSAINGYRNVAYFTQWGVYGRDFKMKELQDSGAAADLTHLNYAFGNIHHQTLTCFEANKAQGTGPNGSDGAGDAWADYGMGYTAANSVAGVADAWDQPLAGSFNQIKQLKAKNPQLKAMLSIGGWTWSKNFSKAAATDASRKKLVSSCIDLYLKGNLPVVDGRGGPGAAAGVFDGFDIDWEWPGSLNGEVGNIVDVAGDKANFKALLKEFRTQLDAYGATTGKHYQLSAFLPANPDDIASGGWNDPENYQYLDFGNIQGYDLHGAWNKTLTGHQGNLYDDPTDTRPANKRYSVDKAVKAYLDNGVPAKQLTVGLAMYGRGWKGATSSAPWGVATDAGPGTWEAGNEDYDKLKNLGTGYFDPVSVASWRYDGNQWWSFDDPRSVGVKGDYIATKKLGGAMWWDLTGNQDGSLLKGLATKFRAAPAGPVTGGSTGGDPTGTDPTGTDPTGTDPTGTDPTGTDPTGTDPTGTDPTGGTGTACAPAWSASSPYNGGATVSHNGKNYKAKWWTLNETPGTAGSPWELVAACGTTDPTGGTTGGTTGSTGGTTGTGTCTAPAWSASATYSGGATVSHAGQKYTAKWWTQNNVPGAEQYGPWQALGAC